MTEDGSSKGIKTHFMHTRGIKFILVATVQTTPESERVVGDSQHNPTIQNLHTLACGKYYSASLEVLDWLQSKHQYQIPIVSHFG